MYEQEKQQSMGVLVVVVLIGATVVVQNYKSWWGKFGNSGFMRPPRRGRR